MKDPDSSSTVERLRPLVGRGGWDFCALWEVSQDQRFLELKACCCGGAESGATIDGGEQEQLPQIGLTPMVQACRDTKSPQHLRTRACDPLAELPPSIHLDSSSSTMIYAEALLSGVSSWMYPSHLPAGSSTSEGAIRTTKVLVPVPGGLVELFVQNHVPEDQQIVDFVRSQFTSPDAAAFAVDYQALRGLDGSGIGIPSDPPSWVTPPIPPCTDHHVFPWDLHAEHSRLYASPLNLFDGLREDDGFLEGSADSIHSERPPTLTFDSAAGIHGVAGNQMSVLPAAGAVGHTSVAESTVSRELGGHDKESVKHEGEKRADSGMEGSDQGDEEEEQKMGRSGRRLSCKNLMAERRRRKKLNDRLYALRALVPKISKMDRASILGDAIEFVKDLQNQVKKLQDQLEETTPEDDATKLADDDDTHLNHENNHNNGHGHLDKLLHEGNKNPGLKHDGSPKGITGVSSVTKAANSSKQNRTSSTNEEKGNQMEPQVEASQVGVNKFFLKVFCEHKRGGFVRLMEAMASLGLDVVNVNVTTSKPLVLNVFEVEKRDSEVVQADQVRSSLLKLILDSDDGGWPTDAAMAVANGGADCHAHHHHHQLDSHHLHYIHHHQP